MTDIYFHVLKSSRSLNADDPKCPAHPKRFHGMIRRLTKEEKSLVRQTGAQLFAQQKRQTPSHNGSEQSRQSPDSSQSRSSKSMAPQAAGEDGRSGRSATQDRAASSPSYHRCGHNTAARYSDDDKFSPVVPSKKRRTSPVTLP
ncbi:hypothetical protein HIM_10028 [Hirsutella minnesotensis 3608]|uniref:Uncharacterized protein n=1 Tax=Hirsutella minnesotensis 3608 TaxID=1043627 RepID=A0A0F8A2P5_9HYPO|nr:hypothetical protein HIM_10028 [Hirsutella minnesotensis 3608]